VSAGSIQVPHQKPGVRPHHAIPKLAKQHPHAGVIRDGADPPSTARRTEGAQKPMMLRPASGTPKLHAELPCLERRDFAD